LWTDGLPRKYRHQPGDLAGADAAQERLPNQQRHLLGPPPEFLQDLRQKTPFAGAGNAQTQRPKAGYEIALVIAVAVIPARLLSTVPRTHHVQVALPLRQQLK
jgi:hypothetical protein